MSANDPLRKRKHPEDDEPKAGEAAHEAPAHAELIDDLDAYQRRIDREWETAKSVYQNRISEIMGEFLKEAPRPKAEPPREKPVDSMESLVHRIADELRALDGQA